MSKQTKTEDNIFIAKKTSNDEQINIFCFNLTNLSKPILFVTLSFLVFVFFIIYGYLLESMFRLPGFKNHSWFLTLFQFFFYSCFSIGESILRKETTRKIPIQNYLLLAFLVLISTGLSNLSVGYLNFATLVVFKSCKLIPVLIGGILIQGKKFNIYEIGASVFMSLGLIFFTLADAKVDSNYSLEGMVLIIGSLCADAAIGNFQEKQMNLHNASNNEIVLYTYTIGFVYLSCIALLLFDIKGAIEFWLTYPKETLISTFMFSISGYVGINIVLHLVKHFGTLIAVTVTACRKIATIIVSFILFSKPFTYQYFWSGMLVLLGIYLNLLSKNPNNFESKLKSLYQKINNYRKKNSPENNNYI